MNYLLDTHSLIWFFSGDNQLPKKVIKEIENNKNIIFVSIASLWEIGIKESICKIRINGGLSQLIDEIFNSNFEILPISKDDILVISTLEFLHRDPFDRLLISQALNEKCVLFSKEEQIKNYKISVLW